MTPEAVIYRYLEAASAEPLDLDRFVRVVGTDADLLGRWVSLLECPATPAHLAAALGELTPDVFRHLAQAQAWSVLPVSGSARLGLDQWQGVLRAACLAETLAEQVHAAEGAVRDSEAVRWRVLLAISGVTVSHDPVMAELNAFRGARPELLEDAGVLLRVFAVVDAVEVLTDVQAAELAQQLLGVAPHGFSEAFAEADHRSRALLAELELTDEPDVDWADRLWVQQRVSMFGGLFAQAETSAELLTANSFASRSLFRSEPYLLRLDGEKQALLPMADGGLGIQLSSISSSIAAAVRENHNTELVDAMDKAVADRQVLRRLGVSEALCLPLTRGAQALGAAVFAVDEDVDNEFAMQLYASELARHLGGRRSEQGAAQELLKRYRAREEKRLREIVHEANNPLSIVHNYLHILELRLQHEPSATEQISMIGNELRRAAEIFQRARELPGMDEVETEARAVFADFDVNDLARRAFELHRGYADEHGVDMHIDLAPGGLIVNSDEQRLAQILNNLIRNAIEASPGEAVTVGSYSGVFREGREGIEVFVSDSGPGLPRSVLESLAEPKASAKGGDHAGLGLHIVHRLVAELKAGIDVRTTRGRGTRFTLFLPLRPL